MSIHAHSTSRAAFNPVTIVDTTSTLYHRYRRKQEVLAAKNLLENIAKLGKSGVVTNPSVGQQRTWVKLELAFDCLPCLTLDLTCQELQGSTREGKHKSRIDTHMKHVQ